MLEKYLTNKKLGGINCLIWERGKVIFQESYGWKNLDTREPMTPDALFRISSMTKPITSVLAMMLVEENKLDLSDPITNWFPQFEPMKVFVPENKAYEDARKPITVFDLLIHTAGFTYSEFLSGKRKEDYSVLGGDIDSSLTNGQWVNALAHLPLIGQPGERFHYGRSTDLLGLLIATIEEKPLGAVMQEKIFLPLGMTDTCFEVAEHKKSRCVANMGFDESGHLTNLETVPLKMALKERPQGLEYESGGQGLWSTINDYLKFAQLFVENGNSNGIHLLKKETIDAICTNQLTDHQRHHATLLGSPLFRSRYGFGLGVAVVMEERGYGSIPCTGSVGSVGWPGAYGGWWSADRTRKKISILLTHSMTTLHQMAQGIGLELYEAIDSFATFNP